MHLIGDLTTELTYAIYGSRSEFGPENGPRQLTPTAIKPKYEARAIYELFRGAGVKMFAVASDVKRVGGDDVYPSLAALPQAVDVLLMSLSGDRAKRAVDEAAAAGIPRIWFQPSTDSPEVLAACTEKGIQGISGCALRHRAVRGWTRFVSPCFYMGLKAAKLPVA